MHACITHIHTVLALHGAVALVSITCQHVCIYTVRFRVGRHGAGADAGEAAGGGDLRRRRHNNGGVAQLPAVPVLLQVEPWDMRDDHLLLQLQVRQRRQVQPRAGEMRLQRLRQLQLVVRPPAAVYLTGRHASDRIDVWEFFFRILASYNHLGLNKQCTTAGHEYVGIVKLLMSFILIYQC